MKKAKKGQPPAHTDNYDPLPEGNDEGVEMQFLDEMGMNDEPSYRDGEDQANHPKSIKQIKARPAKGNYNYGTGIHSSFELEIVKINDLETSYRSFENPKSRAERLFEILDLNETDAEQPNDENKLVSLASFGGATSKSPGRPLKKQPKKTDKRLQDQIIRRNSTIKELMNIDVAEKRKELQVQVDQEEDQMQDYKCIIWFAAPWRKYWDLVIIVMACYQSLIIPLVLAFTPKFAAEMWGWYGIIDTICNIFYLVDIGVNFRTSYIDYDGEEVRQPSKIAKRYICGMFMTDFISSIPYRLIIQQGSRFTLVRAFALLKVARVLRMNKFINDLPINQESKATLKISYLIFQLFLLMHVLGCIWYKITDAEKVWIPPKDFIYAGNPDIYQFWYKESSSMRERYLTTLYCAVLALGGNEMGPRTELEILVIFSIMFALTFYNAYIFGEVTVLWQASSKKTTDFQAQIDISNTAMKNIDLDQQTQTFVRDFLVRTQGTQYDQKELRSFLGMISHSISKQVAVSIFTRIVEKNGNLNKFFNTTAMEHAGTLAQTMRDQGLGALQTKNELKLRSLYVKTFLVEMFVKQMKVKLFEPDHNVIGQFQTGKALYLIAKGECKVSISDDTDKEKQAPKILRVGDYFGEISLVYGCKCTATITANKYCTLAKMSKASFNDILLQLPALKDSLKKGIYNYNDRLLKFIKKRIKAIPYFSNMKEDVLYEVVFSLNTQKYQKDQILQPVGDDATSLFFLQSGLIEVSTIFEGQEFVLERLFRGSILNYRTFFMEEGAAVQLKFSKASVMQELPYSMMQEISDRFPELNKEFQKYRLQIIKDGKSVPLDYMMVLPKAVTRRMITETRKKLLSQKRYIINEKIEKKKSELNRQGILMDDFMEEEIRQEVVSNHQITDRIARSNKAENILKNVVIRMLAQIRNIKSQKTIKEHVEMILRQQKENETKLRTKLRKLIQREYETKGANAVNADALYERVDINLDRLLKMLSGHSQAVDSLERKMEVISSRRSKKLRQVKDTNDFAHAGTALEVQGQELMYKSGDFLDLPMADEDMLSNQSGEDEKQDAFLRQLKHIAGAPNQEIIRDYRRPIEQGIEFKLNTSNSSLHNISSEPSQVEELTEQEEEEQPNDEEIENK